MRACPPAPWAFVRSGERRKPSERPLGSHCNPGCPASTRSMRSCYRPYGLRMMRIGLARRPVAVVGSGLSRRKHPKDRSGAPRCDEMWSIRQACANARARALPQLTTSRRERGRILAACATGSVRHVAEMETDTATIRSAVLADLVPGWRCKPARLIKRRAKFSQARCRTSSPPPSSPVPSRHQQAPPPPGRHARRPPWLRAVP